MICLPVTQSIWRVVFLWLRHLDYLFTHSTSFDCVGQLDGRQCVMVLRSLTVLLREATGARTGDGEHAGGPLSWNAYICWVTGWILKRSGSRCLLG